MHSCRWQCQFLDIPEATWQIISTEAITPRRTHMKLCNFVAEGPLRQLRVSNQKLIWIGLLSGYVTGFEKSFPFGRVFRGTRKSGLPWHFWCTARSGWCGFAKKRSYRPWNYKLSGNRNGFPQNCGRLVCTNLLLPIIVSCGAHQVVVMHHHLRERQKYELVVINQ